nr:PREDICTED: teneurin-2-like [Balearica regulorum gibbericeps]
MDIKDRRHRSLTRGRCGKECRYTSSSLDSEDCRVPTQKSYSSSETLKAYDHDTRMHYGNRVSDLVHRESDEFPRQGTNFTLAELGICEPSPHRSGYCSDIGILHQGYSLSTGSDADSDTEGGMSPEHAIRLWGRGIKSRRSSGLSSRENSALTLTDSDNENKSDEENEGRYQHSPYRLVCGTIPSHLRLLSSVRTACCVEPEGHLKYVYLPVSRFESQNKVLLDRYSLTTNPSYNAFLSVVQTEGNCYGCLALARCAVATRAMEGSATGTTHHLRGRELGVKLWFKSCFDYYFD